MIIKCKHCQKRFHLKNKAKFCSRDCFNQDYKNRRGQETNGYKHGMSGTSFYHRWRTMLQRCKNPRSQKYKNYGKRGIKILWKSFDDFKSDMYSSYQTHVKKFGIGNTTIERINNGGDYSKGNCCWATNKEQSNNRTTNISVTYRERTLNAKDWAKELGVNYNTLYGRLRKGWPLEKCMSQSKYKWRITY